ncbi:hypothetical protein CVT25_004202, partial [Psilocybe cyanescens]
MWRLSKMTLFKSGKLSKLFISKSAQTTDSMHMMICSLSKRR